MTGKEKRDAVRTDLLERAEAALTMMAMAKQSMVGDHDTAGEIRLYQLGMRHDDDRALIASDLMRAAQDALVMSDDDQDINLAGEIQIHLETPQRDLICDAEIELGVGSVTLARMMGAPYGSFKDWKSARREMPTVAKRCLELVVHAKPHA